MKEERRFIRTVIAQGGNGKQYRIHHWIPFVDGVPGTAILLDDNRKTVSRTSQGKYIVVDDDLNEVDAISSDANAP